MLSIYEDLYISTQTDSCEPYLGGFEPSQDNTIVPFLNIIGIKDISNEFI
jgi:hypothetical protein